MTEAEYISVANRAALQCAVDCLRKVQEGEEYGVDPELYLKAMSGVSSILEQAFHKEQIQSISDNGDST